MSPMDQALRDLVREAVAEALERERPRIAEEVATKLGAAIRPEQYISTGKAAAIAGVTPDTIREWVADGHLKRCGHGRLRVRASDLYSLLERRKLQVVPQEDVDGRIDAIAARLAR